MSISKELKKIEPEIRYVQKATVLTKDFLAEETWNRTDKPTFCVKHFDTGKVEFQNQLDLDEKDAKENPIIYVPVDNTALRKGLIILPKEPEETTFKETLDAADAFSLRCYDPCGKEAYVKLLVRVVAGSWFLDRFVQNPQYDMAGSGKFAPLLPIRGPSQSGKNRLAFVLRLLSYRPYFEMSTYRVPSLYRPLDLWNGTLVLDEADFAVTNEKSELIHFLNCRATGTPISRQNPKDPRKTDVFSNFGQTILTQRRIFDDNATESRCLPFYSEVTDKKLPTVETDEMLKQGLELQNMLFYLRLEYFKKVQIDKSAWLNDVADPRLVASLLPLLALSRFEPAIKDTIKNTVKDIEKLKVSQKATSEDGVFVNALWDRIERMLYVQHSGVPGNEVYYFQTMKEDDDGKDVVPLTVKVLADEFKLSARETRKVLNSLNMAGANMPRFVKVADKSWRVIFFEPPKFEKRLREFVVDYEPFSLYDTLKLKRPVTQVTHNTLKTCGENQLGDFLTPAAEKSPCVPSVSSVTSVTRNGSRKDA